MKKITAVFVICLLFFLFIWLEHPKAETYKVLEVVEGDKFYIDFNKDGKKDKDELVHLKGVNTFPLYFGHKTDEYSARYGISSEEAVSIGHLAKKFAKDKLEGKYIELVHPIAPYNPAYYYRFAEIKIFKIIPDTGKIVNGGNFGAMLLQEGLGFAYENKNSKNFNPYKCYENIEKIRKTARYAFKAVPQKHSDFSFNKARYSADSFKKPVSYIVSPQKIFGPVTVFLVNPNTFNKPSYSCRVNACIALLKCINEAKTSIDFALYGLDKQNEILEALLSAQKRGVKIRGVVDIKQDGTYVYSDTLKLKDICEVRSDNKSQLMHNKFFIFDDKKVFTGTMNISTTGSGGYNSNTVVLLDSFEAAKIYKKEFEQMYFGNFQNAKTDNSASLVFNGTNSKLSIFFSPKGSAYEKGILPLVENAEREILISIFYLTHKGMIEALKSAHLRGVEVKIIYDALGANNMKDRVKSLRDAGIKVKVENWGGKNHQKDMVVDGKYFVTGSANFSNSGMNYNDENILIFEDKAMAGFYREHFLKLYNSLDEKYLKIIPRAESFESGNSCYDGVDNNFDGKIDSEDVGCKT